MEPARQISFLHQGNTYLINADRFEEVSVYAKQNQITSFPQPINLSDSLDEGIFATFVDFINNPTAVVTPENCMELLNASIAYDCPAFIKQIESTLVQLNRLDVNISVIQLCVANGRLVEILENHVAKNFSSYTHFDLFASIPCYVLYRIMTWYSVKVIITPELFDFFFEVARRQRKAATPLFLRIDFENTHPADLIRIIKCPDLDFDTLAPNILPHLQHFKEEVGAIQQRLVQKNAAIDMALSEKKRYEDEAEKTEQRQRIVQQRLSDTEAKLKFLQDDLESQTEKCCQTQQSIENARDEARAALVQRDEYKKEREAMVNKEDEAKAAIRDIKQQLADRELERQAQERAASLEAEAAKARAEKEAAAAAAEAEAEAEARERSAPAKSAPDGDRKPERVRPVMTERPPVFVRFDAAQFKSAFVAQRPKLQIAVSPTLRFCLDVADAGRASELEYMWRSAEMGSASAMADYGALIALGDPAGADLALALLDGAAARGEPYALFNRAVIVAGGGDFETAADLVAKAAELGQPDAAAAVKATGIPTV